ncbi:hypothetical protein XthCFBP4691_18870 [Xanthomonas theicola]|uniref:Uncharacterized protein n=1 Tax=Xanthomonas theicola TaxID=56464 RepID=A0A2S6ZAI4_9XANT|nr:hypothetical protein XthCFBP4691_18870 [Xanthomonas theicola]
MAHRVAVTTSDELRQAKAELGQSASVSKAMTQCLESRNMAAKTSWVSPPSRRRTRRKSNTSCGLSRWTPRWNILRSSRAMARWMRRRSGAEKTGEKGEWGGSR